MALCYNFTRVLNIVGLDRLKAHLAAKRSGARLSPSLARLARPIAALVALAGEIRRIFAGFHTAAPRIAHKAAER